MTARRIFWLLLCLMIALAIHYRQAGSDIANLSYKFSRLYLTKEFVAELHVNHDSILVYAEPIQGKPLEIVNLDQLQPIIKKAYRDHLVFIEKQYPEILVEHPETDLRSKSRENLTIIFVAPDTYESLSKIRRQDSIGYIGFFNTIYLKTYGTSYRIEWLRAIIRHEIFHYLNNRYGITAEFEEVAAKRFGWMP